jgi:hypothetical protein
MLKKLFATSAFSKHIQSRKPEELLLICNQKAFWPMAIIYVEDLQVTQNEMKFDFQNQNWNCSDLFFRV